MQFMNLPEEVINGVAAQIHSRTNKDYHIPVVGTPDNLETPQVFEIMQVQRGPGFQERYLQTLGMLIEIARVRGEAEHVLRLKDRYRAKYEFLTKGLETRPTALGAWEAPLHEEMRAS